MRSAQPVAVPRGGRECRSQGARPRHCLTVIGYFRRPGRRRLTAPAVQGGDARGWSARTWRRTHARGPAAQEGVARGAARPHNLTDILEQLQVAAPSRTDGLVSAIDEQD
eukprot:scaffold18871_cov69-Phaeocystis_antarctica.AAC.7